MGLVKGTNCGFVAVAPVGDPLGAFTMVLDNNAYAFKDTSPATAIKVTEIGVWINNATPTQTLEFGVYEHNVGDDNPEALLVGKVSIAKGATGGWKSQTCNITISPNTAYWIACQLDNTTPNTEIDVTNDAGEKLDYKFNETTLVGPWGVSDGTQGRLLGAYAKWEAAAGGVAPTGALSGPLVGCLGGPI